MDKNKESILESIIAKLPGHIYWKDRNCIYLGCNDVQANSLGLKSRHEILGKNDFELFWKEQAPKIREADLRVINMGESITVEEPALLADGRLAIFLSQKEPLKDGNGNIIGILGVSIDITEQKSTEKALQETRTHLEHILDTIPGHVYWKDKQGKYLGCNELQAKDVGFSSIQEMIGKTDHELPWEEKEHADIVRKVDLEVMQTESTLTLEETTT